MGLQWHSSPNNILSLRSWSGETGRRGVAQNENCSLGSRMVSSSACASWRRSGAASVWTISIGVRLRRIGASSMNKLVGFRRLKAMVHPSFPISDPRSSNMKLFARSLNHRAARRRIPVWNRCGHPGTGSRATGAPAHPEGNPLLPPLNPPCRFVVRGASRDTAIPPVSTIAAGPRCCAPRWRRPSSVQPTRLAAFRG